MIFFLSFLMVDFSVSRYLRGSVAAWFGEREEEQGGSQRRPVPRAASSHPQRAARALRNTTTGGEIRSFLILFFSFFCDRETIVKAIVLLPLYFSMIILVY